MATQRAREAFADWCRRYRHHTEETQADLALVVGVHRTSIVRYEAARVYPSRRVRILFNQLAREAGFQPVPPPW